MLNERNERNERNADMVRVKEWQRRTSVDRRMNATVMVVVVVVTAGMMERRRGPAKRLDGPAGRHAFA